MNIAQIKQIPISDLLARLGHRPVRTSGGELFYRSPLAPERTPSFAVNDQKGLWNDFGRGCGGTIIDLGMRLFNTGSVSDAVRRIGEVYATGTANIHRPEQPTEAPKPVLRLRMVQSLGKNPALTGYLEGRGLLETARETGAVREVYYDLERPKGVTRHYFGVGWQNLSGGWEVASAYGKLCIGRKDLTIAGGTASTGKTGVFEGMFDYLAAVRMGWVGSGQGAVLLNSTAMAGRAVSHMRENSLTADLFLDNDRAGDEATDRISTEVECRDRRHMYRASNDVNDFLLGGERMGQRR